MYVGYNTNGMAHHALADAIEILAELGYGGVAVTLDHCVLNPFGQDLPSQLADARRRLQRHQLRTVIETGARFLLDPRHKHEPTLVSPRPEDRARRVEFARRAIDIAGDLGSDCVSLWSGRVRDDAPHHTIWDRLVSGLGEILAYADARAVNIGFEPEPGMWIDDMSRLAQLRHRIRHPRLRLTLDIGHLHCQGETPLANVIKQWAHQLLNVHLEDMRTAVHEHLMFGEGDIDFQPVIDALREARYTGGVFVELSRHSHTAVTAAREARAFLSRLGC